MPIAQARLFSQFNSTVKAVTMLIEMLDVRVTRTSIRDKFVSLPNYPNLNLNDIVEAFDEWHVQPFAFTATQESLREVPLPSIAYIEDKDPENQASTSGTFVVLNTVDDDQVIYYHPVFGEVSELIRQFDKNWKGAMLSIDPD